MRTILDWDRFNRFVAGLSSKLHKKADVDSLSDVAFSGRYYDLKGTPDFPAVDDVPMLNSNNLVKSGGVYTEFDMISKDLGNLINVRTDTNKIITVSDASDKPFSKLQILGKSHQATSPSLNTPQQITSSNAPNINVFGKNLTSIPDHKEQFSNKYYNDYFPQTPKVLLQPNMTYTIAFDYVVNFADYAVTLSIGYGDTAYKNDIAAVASYPTQTTGRMILSFTTPSAFSSDAGTPYLQIRFARMSSNGNLNVDISNIIVAQGQYTILPYESYKPVQSITCTGYNLLGIPDGKGGWAVRDRIYLENGAVNYEKDVARYEFTGTENITASDTLNGYYISLQDIKLSGDNNTGMCTHFLWGDNNGSYSIYGVVGVLRMQNFKNLYPTVNDLKAFLITQKSAGTPVTVYYPIITPVVTDITNTDIGQSIINLHSNNPNTTIICDDDINVTYRADTKSYVDNGLANISAFQNSGYHNSIYRGKDISANEADGSMYTNIAKGTFDDIFIGDYFIKAINGTNYVLRVAGCDVYYNRGDTALTKHHIVVVPDTVFGHYQISDTGTLDGGYVGSKMYTDTLPLWAGYLSTAFGTHLLTLRELFVNSISSNIPSDWSWYDSKVGLMTSEEVVGCGAFGLNTSGYPFNIGIAYGQLPLFRLSPDKICIRHMYWLRNIVNVATFCAVNDSGELGRNNVANYQWLRPRFLLG